jgi:hypothetical protein
MEDFAAALQDLKTFNRMVASHPGLADALIKGDHHFLQWQQAQLFSAFRAYRARGAMPAADRLTPGLAVSGLAACALTACAALFRKADVVIFSVDKISSRDKRDFRIEGLYRFLEGKRLAYVEIFHAMLGRAFFRNAWSRRRSAIYHEAIGFMARFSPGRRRRDAETRRLAASLPCSEFEETDRPFVRAQAETALRAADVSRFRIRRYRRILARLRPKAILAIDDTRHYQAAIAAARSLGIPFHAFQHGHFTKYHAGWLSAGVGEGRDARPDVLYVWNPYWKKELLRLGTNFREDEIRVGGDPKGDVAPPEAKPYAPPSAGETIELLVPFETDAPHAEIARVLRALIATGRIKIWLKTRPDWDTAEQLRKYGLDGTEPSRAEAVADAAPVLGRIHAVAGVFTSYLYDAIAMRKPVFVLKTSHDGGEGMVLNGLADAFDAEASGAAERLAAACREAAPKLETRARAYLDGAGSLTKTLEGLLPQA